MRWLVAALLVAAVTEFTTGCATTYQAPARQNRPAATRCLMNPGETDTRPLFFLFCIESP
jgi:hypothetical protein